MWLYKKGELYKLVNRTFCWPNDSILDDASDELLEIDWGKYIPVMFIGIDSPLKNSRKFYKFLYKGIMFRIDQHDLDECIEGPWELCCKSHEI